MKKSNCGCGGKHSKVISGKYAEGGAVQPVQNPATGPFAQGSNKYLTMIQQGRANARSSLSSRNPADVVNKYFPAPPPPAAAAPAPVPTAPVAPKESNNDRRGQMPDPYKGPRYTGVKDMFDGGGAGRNRAQAGATKSVPVAKDFSRPSGSKVGKPRGGK